MKSSIHRSKVVPAVTVLLLTLSAISSARSNEAPAGGGSVITNQAMATYSDDFGETYDTASDTVTVTVLAVASIGVGPDETFPSDTLAPQERATRVFRVCNTGNAVDSFTVTQNNITAPATMNGLYFDIDGSGTMTSGDVQITQNQTVSPQLLPGSCIGVLAIIDANDAAPHTTITISITSRSTAVGAADAHREDAGTIINAVGTGARLTDPDNPNLPPVSLIDGKAQAVLSIGNAFTSSISFKNSGDSVARDVVVTQSLPPGIDYIPDTLKVVTPESFGNGGGASNTPQPKDTNPGVVIRLAQVAPDEMVRLSFQLRISGGFAPGSGAVSGAVITAANMLPVRTQDAILVIDPTGLIFSGRGGSSSPIPGARVELFRDQAGARLLELPVDSGFAPNSPNVNPFATDSGGHFSFKLSAGDIGSNNSEANYFMRITAAGFLTRMIQLSLRPTKAGLFALNAHALDAQSLADAGFILVQNDLRVEDLAALVMNIPMFEASGLQITKSSDRARAEIGDIVTYRVEVHNPTASPVNHLTVEDHLPSSFHYANGSALLTGTSTPQQSIEPQISGSTLTFQLGDLAPGATAQLVYRVRVGANANKGAQENTAVASGSFASGEQTQTAPARASVYVTAGIFSTQQVLLGRVFIDTNQNGAFDDGDRPAPGVRLYLNNGQSVITDAQGLYNFPALGDGSVVVSLDPVTVPPHYALTDSGRLAGKSWTRLLRTPMGGGGLLRQNFALVDTKSTISVPEPGAAATESQRQSAEKGAGENHNPVAPGTYEFVSTQSIEPVAVSSVRVLSPRANEICMAPALEVEAQVDLNSTVRVEINGQEVSEKSVGRRTLDRKNQVATFTFVGINLRPGPNKLRVTPIDADGTNGNAQELIVMGRGPAKRLEIVTDKPEVQAGGSDSTAVHVRGFDKWNNPAMDGDVGVETSLGRLISDASEVKNEAREAANSNKADRAPMVAQLQGGEVTLKLISSGAPGEARVRATVGESEAEGLVRFTAEVRPRILVGMAEMSFGRGIPEVGLRGEQGNYRSRLSFFYSGKLFGDKMLTLSYDSQRPINRTAGRDRMFQLDPNDRVYPLFGDSSTRFEAAETNSKLYARIDRKRSYAMFGDFEADMDAPLLGYGRKLTGVKLHLENASGDALTLTGARPDTAFARDVFPAGSLGLLQLSNPEVLPGSENVVLEIRDRRNPEVIISRETLARGLDYNLDSISGQIFMLRYISTFDYLLNLTQIVVTYEHRANSMASAVYTARAHKNFKSIGFKLGLSSVMQTEGTQGNFFLGGLDAEKKLPGGGLLQMAWAMSSGEVLGTGNFFDSEDSTHDGSAYQATLIQPLPFRGAVVHARYLNASAAFFNPFGATVTPGSRRGEVTFDMKPLPNSVLKLGFTNEQNHTANVENSRVTFSAGWDETVKERFKLHLGFDHRAFNDELNDKQINSNLITAGADVKVTDKLQLSAKREQNLGRADPTYPDQTTLGATYQVSALTKIFFTQRLASATINPIGDFSTAGFAVSSVRHETAFGVETRVGKYTAMTGRYQLENGINGTDSFAVTGLQNRLPLTKEFSLELGFERGFHLAGPNSSFNSATLGFGWQPNEDFRANARYEFRDRNGHSQLLALGAAGRLREGVTALSRIQWSRGAFGAQQNATLDATAALAIRPINSDRRGLLFTYTHRSLTQALNNSSVPNRDRIDSLSTDGYQQVTKQLDVYGKVALRFNANGQAQLPFISSLSFLTQARAQYLLTRQIDWAFEMRALFQPSSDTMRSTYATEGGFWVLPDLRLGGGYNFTAVSEPAASQILPTRKGFYFTITTKLSNLFDLLGTSKAGLADSKESRIHDKDN